MSQLLDQTRSLAGTLTLPRAQAHPPGARALLPCRTRQPRPPKRGASDSNPPRDRQVPERATYPRACAPGSRVHASRRRRPGPRREEKVLWLPRWSASPGVSASALRSRVALGPPPARAPRRGARRHPEQSASPAGRGAEPGDPLPRAHAGRLPGPGAEAAPPSAPLPPRCAS